MKEKAKHIVKKSFLESASLKMKISESNLLDVIQETGLHIINCLSNDNKVIFAGNGGSFADSQHLAAEFVSRFLFDRNALPAIALGTNNSNITAIGNDYGYKQVFARELTALGNEGDIFIPITTSGNSENIIEAVRVANEKKIQTIGLTGNSGGKLDSLCNCIKVPSDEVPRIQECHILIGHILCQIAEEGIFKSSE
jgi:D-sedoheptulose 7-phosphate isomerase